MSVEQKIKELLESVEAKQEEEVLAEEVVETEEEVIAEEVAETEEVAEEVVAEEVEEIEEAKKDVKEEEDEDEESEDESDEDEEEVSEAKSVKEEEDEESDDEDEDEDEEDDMEEGAMKKKGYKKEDIDLSDDVSALIEGAELSEEFQEKAKTIFEAAVITRVEEAVADLEEKFEAKLAEEVEGAKSELVEKVDSYLGYIVEQWMKDNELAVERGLKTEIAEDFIASLKNVFVEHYIDVPEEKYDVLGEQASKIDSLEEKLNEQMEKNIELVKQYGDLVKEQTVAQFASDLAETDAEKFKSLAENIQYESQDKFMEDLQTIKESYFKKVSDSAVEEVVLEESVQTEQVSGIMSQYAKALAKR